MEYFVDGSLAVIYVLVGMILGGAVKDVQRWRARPVAVRSEQPEEEPPAPPDDPTRDPNYCWTHSQIYPACAPQHEEQK